MSRLLKQGDSHADTTVMSAFGSLYDDESAETGRTGIGEAPRDLESGDVRDPDTEHADTEHARAHRAGDDAEDARDEPPAGIDAPDTSLEAFAAQAFASLPSTDEQPDEHPDAAVVEQPEERAAPFTATDPRSMSLAPDDPPSPGSARGSAPGSSGGHEPGEPREPDAATLAAIDDDLLPARPPARSVTLPGIPAIGSLVKTGPLLKIVAVVALVALGFFGYRALVGSGGDPGAAPAAPPPPALETGTAEAPAPTGGTGNDPASALDGAELAAAEADLRLVGVQAQATFAETGTFALSPEEWDARIPREVRSLASGEAAPGVLLVTATDHAVCFETLTALGVTAAVGITASGHAFASDPDGASVCTTDPAALSSWDTGLVTGA